MMLFINGGPFKYYHSNVAGITVRDIDEQRRAGNAEQLHYTVVQDSDRRVAQAEVYALLGF